MWSHKNSSHHKPFSLQFRRCCTSTISCYFTVNLCLVVGIGHFHPVEPVSPAELHPVSSKPKPWPRGRCVKSWIQVFGAIFSARGLERTCKDGARNHQKPGVRNHFLTISGKSWSFIWVSMWVLICRMSICFRHQVFAKRLHRSTQRSLDRGLR